MTDTETPPIPHGRLGAAMGLLFTVGTIAGNTMSNSGDSPQTDAESILANVRRTHTPINAIGLGIELLGFAALLFFAAYLYRILRRGEGRDGWLAGSVLIAASIDLSIKIGSGAPLAAANTDKAGLTPDLARTLIDLNTGGFILTGFAAAVFVLATVASAWTSRALPRGLCWAGMIIAIPGLVTPMFGVYHPADYVPIPYLLTLVWIGAVAVTRLIAENPRHKHPMDESDASPATTGDPVSISTPERQAS